jgi:hypothetical protein
MNHGHLLKSLQQYLRILVAIAFAIFAVAVFSSEAFNLCIEKVYLTTDPLDLCCGNFSDFFGAVWNEVTQNGERYEPDLKDSYFGYPLKVLFGVLYPFRADLNVLRQIMEYIGLILIIVNFAPAVLESVGDFFAHLGRDYPKTCLIGWNIFVKEPKGLRLFIPTEDTFQLSDLFLDDRILYQSVLNDILNTKDFIVEFSNARLKEETSRRAKNMISKAVKSSQWPKYAHLKKNSHTDQIEKALILLTYEKDAPVKLTRIWMIFPHELEMLLDYNGMSAQELQKIFVLEQPHWVLRIQNLIQWAVRHFEDEIPSDQVDLPIILN